MQELLRFFLTVTLVDEGQIDAAVQEGKLTQTLGNHVKVVDRAFFENGFIRQKVDDGTGFIVRTSIHHSHFAGDLPVGVGLAIHLAATTHFGTHFLGKGVYNTHPNPVQAAGHLVAATAEFTAGVEYGHNHFEGWFFHFRVQIHRNPTAFVTHGDGVVRFDGHLDFLTIACKGFVNGVIDDFVDKMVQTGAVGGPDVHPRTHTNRFKAL